MHVGAYEEKENKKAMNRDTGLCLWLPTSSKSRAQRKKKTLYRMRDKKTL